jgi:hypothetical protein
MNFDALPTLGSVRERLGYFACKTEEGELNTTLNKGYEYIYFLETLNKKWAGVAEQMYNVMLAHETVDHDVWNKSLEACHKMMMGKYDDV